tara:strand:+ start:481 stop:588 length:108 start_codon:yes stop_codon:yes gene_type:complete
MVAAEAKISLNQGNRYGKRAAIRKKPHVICVALKV